MFSPILPISAMRSASTLVLRSGSAASAAASAGARANAWNSSFLATKSVSQFTSTIEPTLPDAPTSIATMPSAATRVDALAALLPSLTRRISSALAMLPCASASAFLHSIIGASVFSRNSLTMPAVTSAIVESFHAFIAQRGGDRPHRIGLPIAQPARPGSDGNSGFRAGVLADFDELVVGHARDDPQRRIGLALQDRIGDPTRIQANRATGVVVARDHVRNALRRMVGIDHPDHRNTELVRLGDRDLVVPDVDHEQRVGQRVHLLDAADR